MRFRLSDCSLGPAVDDMRRLLLLTIAVVLTMPLWTAQRDNRADAQLQAAINKETVEGDLKSAVDLYKKVAQSGNRAVAAKALVQHGSVLRKAG